MTINRMIEHLYFNMSAWHLANEDEIEQAAGRVNAKFYQTGVYRLGVKVDLPTSRKQARAVLKILRDDRNMAKGLQDRLRSEQYSQDARDTLNASLAGQVERVGEYWQDDHATKGAIL